MATKKRSTSKASKSTKSKTSKSKTSKPKRSKSKSGKAVQLGMTMEKQQQTLWCWSAVSVSVKKFLDSKFKMTQCQQANKQLNQTTCCTDGSSSNCNHDWYLQQALASLGALREMRSEAVSMATVKKEIDAKFPIGCRIGWNGGGGHFLCIAGYEGKDTLYIEDSLYGPSKLSYDEFAKHYQHQGTWTNTYLTKR